MFFRYKMCFLRKSRYKGYRPRWKLLARCFVARLHCSYRMMRIYRVVTEWGIFKKLKEFMKK
ncbi:MAG TPA: hypothetical protein PLT76_06175 [Candidatus Omnitrophota bacterium]|nr:hypothetical protein [Candidatus Omnitrophota bacterium]HPB68724.1 hypothetical protein [Candidatus Omnitrophota bacterium]HQO58291.1 hypothetical protein [Candidatus Omnitrophota bacterium]HQP11418.1 hypothetical protein [Candidatus Omnitrophota bacterium]